MTQQSLLVSMLAPGVALMLLQQWSLLLQWTVLTCMVASIPQPLASVQRAGGFLGILGRSLKGVPSICARLLKGEACLSSSWRSGCPPGS
jgi:hypothetical protein